MTEQQCSDLICKNIVTTNVEKPAFSLCPEHAGPIEDIDPEGNYIVSYNADGSMTFEDPQQQ